MKTIPLVSSVILVLFIAFAATVEAQIPEEGTTLITASSMSKSSKLADSSVYLIQFHSIRTLLRLITFTT